MDNLYNYDYQFRLIVVGDSTVGKVYLSYAGTIRSDT
jgi:hypothetical protein